MPTTGYLKYGRALAATAMMSLLSCGQLFAQTTDTAQEADNAVTIQPYEIKGIIKDKKTGDIVPFATVFFPGSPLGTPADLDGTFILTADSLPGDILEVNVIGYKPYTQKIDRSQRKFSLVIELENETNMLSEVVIRPGEDPAIILLKNVIRRKRYNDPGRTDNYSYESYTKVEVDLMNLTKEQFEKYPYLKNFSYIYKSQDTTADGRSFLPFFFTEAISDYYFQRRPLKTKEFIKASQVRGIQNESITQFLGKMYLAIDPYDNFINFFGKQFVSPINNAGPTYYKYRIIDTTRLNGYDLIKLSFTPHRLVENCFSGTIVIVDSVYALQNISAQLPKDVNLNWVKNAAFYQQFDLQEKDSIWFCVKEGLSAELTQPAELLKFPALYVHRNMSYKNIRINDSKITDLVNNKKYKEDIIVADGANTYTEDLWKTMRHKGLSKNEKAIYGMYDTLEQDPKFRKFKNTAKIIFTGIVNVGPFEFGPYWSIYSTNVIEGTRLRFSMGTNPKLFKDVYLNGYVAYGTRDEKVKYNANMLWLLQRHPRTYLNLSYTYDVDHSINYNNPGSFDYVFSTAVRKKGIPQKYLFNEIVRAELYKEYYGGFSHKLTFDRRNIAAYAPLPDSTIFKDNNSNPSDHIINTEADLQLRYAWHEKFIEGNYYRVSLGSKYPIAELHIATGLKNVWEGNYDYKKILFSVSDRVNIPHLGVLHFKVFGGKYFGTAPYPLLEIHPGNEFYIYRGYAFNMMNRFEFISDQFLGFNLEHNIGGGLFNYIPGIKKLKLRQFWTAKVLTGSLSDENKNINLNKGFAFRTLQGSPYVELGTGIENIFRLFRVDFVWRVTPKRLPTEANNNYFGVFGSIKIDF